MVEGRKGFKIKAFIDLFDVASSRYGGPLKAYRDCGLFIISISVRPVNHLNFKRF